MRRTLVSLSRQAPMPEHAGMETLGRQVDVVAWSTFGPHPIGSERFVTACSGSSFAQVAGGILGYEAWGRTLISGSWPAATPDG
jgi:hypothetical protein